MNSLRLKDKLCYALGDVGCNFIWATVGSFLTLYYTDNVGISAGVIGTIMLVSRLLDGVSDLVFGTVLDKTKTKMGKARPWFLASIPAMAIAMLLLFNVPMSLGDNGKIVYATLTYIFMAVFAYTVCNLSYNALLSLMTDDQKSRSSASTLRFFFTYGIAIVLSFLTPKLVASVGWSKLSIIYAALASVCLLITFLGTKERYEAELTQKEKDKLPVMEGFKLLFKNKFFIPLTILFVLVYLGYTARSGIGIYFARDILGSSDMYGILTLASILPVFIYLPLFQILSSKFGKWKTMVLAFCFAPAGDVVMMSGSDSLTMIIIGLVLCSANLASVSSLFALVSDGVVYGEWKNGVRQDGLFNSATSFGMKVGTGLGSAVVGWGLAFGNYNPEASMQAAATISSIKFLYIYFHLITVVLMIICVLFCNIDKVYPTAEKELSERRKNEKN